MGFLDSLADSILPSPGGTSRSKHRDARKHARSRSSSRSRGGIFTTHHNPSRSSLFGFSNRSRSSFFNTSNRSSYYKRSPRSGFLQRAYRKLKRLLRDLVRYAKDHPWKVFSLVIMPLVTTGVLGGLLARFGLRIPPSLERMVGVASRAASGDSLGLVSDAMRMAGGMGGVRRESVSRGHDGRMQWERRRATTYGAESEPWGDTVADMARRFF